MFPDYPIALRWLYGTQLTGIKLGLAPMRRLLDALGWEPGGTRFLHVAGTNGKGSVCAMLDAVLRADGRRTGLFTSPHLVSFRERIRLDGEMIPEADVAAGLARLRALTAGWEPSPPTFFELTTALALDWFRQRGAEVVVLETGLGGRLDATNVLARPAACVLTSIGLDHTSYLGNTLAAIAGEKAGVLKPGVPAVSLPQLPEVYEVLVREAARVGAPLRCANRPLAEDVWVRLPGSHQRANAALALDALEAAGLRVREEAVRRGLTGVAWPGRFQRCGDDGRVILDGAHNPAAAARLAQTWREEFGATTRATVVLGVLRDKDATGVIRALATVAARFVAVPVRTSPRTTPAEELRAALTEIAPNVPAETAADLPDALARARRHGGERVLVTGSLFLVGEALALLAGAAAPETSWQ